MLDAAGLFRLDVTVNRDSMRVIVRNLSPGPVAYADDGYGRTVIVQGDTAGLEALRPGHHQVEFTLGTGRDAVEVSVILATLRLAQDGIVRITAQATLRRAV